MTNAMPQLVSLTPVVVGHKRVTLSLETINLPSQANVRLDFDISTDPLSQQSKEQGFAEPEEIIGHTPYPNVELSILDDDHNPVAQLFVVENTEEFISMTMHIRRPKPGKTYIARADMLHNNQLIQTLTTPFQLSSAKVEIE